MERATPDVLDDILSKCEPKASKIISIDSRRPALRGAKRRVRSLVAAAAALALVVGIFGFGAYDRAYAADTVVRINADADVKLEVNVKGDVVSVSAAGEDAQQLLTGLDLKGTDVESAARAIADALAEAGYVTRDDNSILITVEADDPEKAGELERRLMDAVLSALAEKDIAGAVIGLIPEQKTDAAETADAKSALIDKALENLNGYTRDELNSLSVNQLNLLIEDRDLRLEGVVTLGKASESAIVDRKTAEVTATAHAGMTEKGGFAAGVEMDCKYGKLVYDVSFEDGSLSFSYNIDAVSGLILSWAAKALDSDAAAGSDKSSISLDQAKDIAFDHAGLSMNDVRRIAINVNDSTGGLTYDVQFAADGMEYEYDVDASTGVIIKYAAALIEGVMNSASGSAGTSASHVPDDMGDFPEVTPEDVSGIIGRVFELIERIG